LLQLSILVSAGNAGNIISYAGWAERFPVSQS
jgi:hypothetical protein